METQTIKKNQTAKKVTEKISGSEAIVKCLIEDILIAGQNPLLNHLSCKVNARGGF